MIWGKAEEAKREKGFIQHKSFTDYYADRMYPGVVVNEPMYDRLELDNQKSQICETRNGNLHGRSHWVRVIDMRIC
jgi:hypothetical protein